VVLNHRLIGPSEVAFGLACTVVRRPGPPGLAAMTTGGLVRLRIHASRRLLCLSWPGSETFIRSRTASRARAAARPLRSRELDEGEGF
jgi:hypothetical protein